MPVISCGKHFNHVTRGFHYFKWHLESLVPASLSPSTTDPYLPPPRSILVTQAILHLMRLISGCRKTQCLTPWLLKSPPQSKQTDSGSSIHWLLIERKLSRWWAGNVGVTLQKNRCAKNVQNALHKDWCITSYALVQVNTPRSRAHSHHVLIILIWVYVRCTKDNIT